MELSWAIMLENSLGDILWNSVGNVLGNTLGKPLLEASLEGPSWLQSKHGHDRKKLNYPEQLSRGATLEKPSWGNDLEEISCPFWHALGRPS